MRCIALRLIGTTLKRKRSPFRDDVLELIANAPAKGIPVSAVLALPVAGSRDAVDHLLGRMVVAGEIERCARGRYVLAGTLQRQTAPAAPTPRQRHIEPPVTGAAPTRRTGGPPATRPAHDALVEELLFKKLGFAPKQPARIDPADFDKFCAQVGSLRAPTIGAPQFGRHCGRGHSVRRAPVGPKWAET